MHADDGPTDFALVLHRAIGNESIPDHAWIIQPMWVAGKMIIEVTIPWLEQRLVSATAWNEKGVISGDIAGDDYFINHQVKTVFSLEEHAAQYIMQMIDMKGPFKAINEQLPRPDSFEVKICHLGFVSKMQTEDMKSEQVMFQKFVKTNYLCKELPLLIKNCANMKIDLSKSWITKHWQE